MAGRLHCDKVGLFGFPEAAPAAEMPQAAGAHSQYQEPTAFPSWRAASQSSGKLTGQQYIR